jgi:hypothetical protein
MIALAHAVEENSVYSLQELCDMAVATGFPNVHKGTICRFLNNELDYTRKLVSLQNQNRNMVCLKLETNVIRIIISKHQSTNCVGGRV